MKKIILLFALAIIFFACKDPYLDTPYTNNIENFPAATYMELDSTLNVTLWVQLLKHADLFNSMNLQASYTCFVPDNDAVKAYLQQNGFSSVTQIPVDEAKLLVRYHTVKGTKYSAVDFTDGMIPDSTASGDYLTTAYMQDGGQVQINGEAVIQKTKQVTNAYIHVINSMLIPVTETIWEKLQKPGFTIMKELVVKTGFQEKLNTVITTENTSTGDVKVRKYRYTLFAVPDSVFVKAGIDNINELSDSLKANTDYTSIDNKLYIFMAYHLLNQQYSFAELSYYAETDNTRSKNYNTMAVNQLINVSEKNKILYINWDKTALTGTELIKKNKNCKNGVVHDINGLMLIKTPSPAKVRWELTDFPDLSFITFYRKAAGSSTQSHRINTGELSCYKWLSVPESKIGLTYELPNKNESVKIKALNADYLVISLGTFGWVEMETPAFIAGKYAVYCEHFNPKGTEVSGKLLFILDGVYLGSQISTSGASKTTDQYLTNTKIGEITFSQTGKHKIRILAGDNTSSYLDCITFTPM